MPTVINNAGTPVHEVREVVPDQSGNSGVVVALIVIAILILAYVAFGTSLFRHRAVTTPSSNNSTYSAPANSGNGVSGGASGSVNGSVSGSSN